MQPYSDEKYIGEKPRRVATFSTSTRLILIVLSCALVVSISISSMMYKITYSFILLTIFYSLVRDFFIRALLTPPTIKMTSSLEDRSYEQRTLLRQSYPIQYFQKGDTEGAPFAILIHGWSASSKRMRNIAEIFSSRGFNTVVVDMRSHGTSLNIPEWTVQQVIDDVYYLIEFIAKSNPDSKFLIYGHSLGAYVTLGLHRNLPTINGITMNFDIILESPMTSYEFVFDDITKNVKFLRPIVKRWLSQGFQKIHPGIAITTFSQLSIPDWGFPQGKCLVIYPTEDRRLGPSHLELLQSCDVNNAIEFQEITSLTHSKSSVNIERDEFIEQWIEGYSSSETND